MTKTYWTVVYRPLGSKCWTLAPRAFLFQHGADGYFWYGKEGIARETSKAMQNAPYSCIECRHARVEVEE